MATPDDIQAAVRILRDELGLTQEKFAVEIGKTFASVQRYEQVSAPTGTALVPFITVAQKANRPDLVSFFSEALNENIGPVVETLWKEYSQGRNLEVEPDVTETEKSWLRTWLECMRECPEDGVEALQSAMLAFLRLSANQNPETSLSDEGYEIRMGEQAQQALESARTSKGLGRRRKQPSSKRNRPSTKPEA